MSTTVANFSTQAATAERSNPAWQAYQILHLGFTVAPILAGVDKFLHLLCNWDQYLAPWVYHLSPISGHTLLLVTHAPELASRCPRAVLAGLGFNKVQADILKPRIGAPVVGAWLCLIILNLLTMGSYLDVALRDLGLALAAFALWRLADQFAR